MPLPSRQRERAVLQTANTIRNSMKKPTGRFRWALFFPPQTKKGTRRPADPAGPAGASPPF